MQIDSDHCYHITYMGTEKYIIPKEDEDEGYQFWAYSGTGWPRGLEYLEWPEVAIIRDKIYEVHESRHLNEMDIVADKNGEEKRPEFLTKLKF